MIKMLAQKTGDSFFEIDFSRKCYAANRSSVTLYKICGESGYINLGKVFQGTIMECKQFVFDNISHLADPAEHYLAIILHLCNNAARTLCTALQF